MGGQRAENTGARITAQNLRGAVSRVEVYSKRAGQPPHQGSGGRISPQPTATAGVAACPAALACL